MALVSSASLVGQRRQNPAALGQHGFAGARRADKQQIVPARGGNPIAPRASLWPRHRPYPGQARRRSHRSRPAWRVMGLAPHRCSTTSAHCAPGRADPSATAASAAFSAGRKSSFTRSPRRPVPSAARRSRGAVCRPDPAPPERHAHRRGRAACPARPESRQRPANRTLALSCAHRRGARLMVMRLAGHFFYCGAAHALAALLHGGIRQPPRLNCGSPPDKSASTCTIYPASPVTPRLVTFCIHWGLHSLSRFFISIPHTPP